MEASFPTKSVLDIAKNLYMDVETADVYFIFNVDGEDQRIPAHKNILATGSSVFRSMFYGKLKEEGDIKIVDASPKGFMEFLAIFYLQETKITNENFLDFVNLANKYDIPEGVDICEQFLLTNFDVGELCSRFALAIKFNLNQLKHLCQLKYRLNAVEVFSSDSFINCPKDILKLILLIDDPNCIETDVFNACKSWAENACKRSGSDVTDQQNLRHQLGECFYLIPFTTMRTETFSNIAFSNRALFTLDEIVDIMAFITAGTSTEHTRKFIKGNNANVIFDWKNDHLVVFNRDDTEENIKIFCDEYTTFSSSHKLLFGGFKFYEIKRSDESITPLSANISITKQSGPINEVQETIRIMTHDESFWPTFIAFNKPIIITPFIKYVIRVDFSTNDLAEDSFVNGWECNGSDCESTKISYEDISLLFYPNPAVDHYSIISQFHFNRL